MKAVKLKQQETLTFTDQMVNLYSPSGMSASLLSFGASLYSLLVPDRHGNLVDVVLGHRDLKAYVKNPEYLGVTVGRNANRIKGGSFEINGTTYQLARNNGNNNLHSNPHGFDKRLWKPEVFSRERASSVSYSLVSPDGDGGFPGNMRVSVTYTLFNNTLEILYQATTDADTIFNPTNHSYFNLNGEQNGYALDQYLWINANSFTPVDAELIPTGEIESLDDSPLDFRHEKVIEKDVHAELETIRIPKGFDHNYVLNQAGKFRTVATLRSDLTGIKMTVMTDRPGLHFYCGGSLNGNSLGKSVNPYEQYAGVCFETQTYPDAIHHPNFPSPILKAGTAYESRTAFQFSTYLL
ncbi:MAG: aldose epimerase family protein [Anaerolineaceae bacterium]